jgi:hypothetical protein
MLMLLLLLHQEGGGGGEGGRMDWLASWLAGYDLVVAENQEDKKSSQAVVSWVPFVLLLLLLLLLPFHFRLVESSSIRTFLLHQQ